MIPPRFLFVGRHVKLSDNRRAVERMVVVVVEEGRWEAACLSTVAPTRQQCRT